MKKGKKGQGHGRKVSKENGMEKMAEIEIIVIEEIGKGLNSRKINGDQEFENCRYVKEQVTE